jgi:hypothetical protein
MSQDPALSLLFKSHPWHGVAIGPDALRRVTVFVEIVPADTVKYELDKDSVRFAPALGALVGQG